MMASEQFDRLVVLPSFFKGCEVAHGFWAKSGFSLAYVESALLTDRASGW